MVTWIFPDKLVPEEIPFALPIPNVPLFTNTPAFPVELFETIYDPQFNVPPALIVSVLGSAVVRVVKRKSFCRVTVLPELIVKSTKLRLPEIAKSFNV